MAPIREGVSRIGIEKDLASAVAALVQNPPSLVAVLEGFWDWRQVEGDCKK